MAKVALLTGASTGIGLSTSVALAQAGFTTVATMRDLDKADALRARAQADAVELDIRALDVSDPGAIKTCVDGVIDRHGRVDVLVNNAGYGYVGTIEQTPIEEARKLFDVNFFGVWSMTGAVLPHMRAQGSGRIISLSSVGGIIGQPFNEAYCGTKFAVEGMMESLLPVARQFGVFVSLVEPGAVNTNFVDSVQPSVGRSMGGEDDPYRPYLTKYLSAATKVFAAIGQTGDDIAAVIVEAATAEQPHFRYQTSAAALAVAEHKFADPSGDSIIAFNGARFNE